MWRAVVPREGNPDLEGQTDYHVQGGRARDRARVWLQGWGKLAPEAHSLRIFFPEAAGD